MLHSQYRIKQKNTHMSLMHLLHKAGYIKLMHVETSCLVHLHASSLNHLTDRNQILYYGPTLKFAQKFLSCYA
jgi:hypothetical protein